MKQFKNILLVLDGNSNPKLALTRAFELAKANKAHLKIIDVLENLAPEIQFGTASELTKLILEKQDLMDQAILSRKTEIQNTINSFNLDNISISSDVLNGKPYFEIIREVLRFNFDLVIKNAEGEAGLMCGILGSNDIHLIRNCICPVWLIKPDQSIKFNRILAAVDTNPFSNNEEEDLMNRKIVDLALSLARKEHSELHVLHVWDFIGNSRLNSWGANIPGLKLKEFKAKEKIYRKESLNQLISLFSFNDVNSKAHLIEGDPKKEIAKFAKDKNIDLLVMGTVGRSGIPGLIIGNTAETILNKINCSLLTIKPDGFISPITLENEN
ncbi:MAG: universal stress protein [Candidatus Nitronauta litoralis]|uniref:Universal stress protein n=1 Tax=Candidatus Nitronauta litoralis TaxID=2705533 RepID=A0A7T0FZZ2_9BACT|nr:MAG: universal stress protein [Candidatus Nitronauta litoralis]